jgi:hypothetical protein
VLTASLSTVAVASVGDSSVALRGANVFCEGGTAEGATVARGRGVVLRPATVVKGNATVVRAEGRVLATGRLRWSGVRAPSQGSGEGHAEAVGRSGGVTPPRRGGGNVHVNANSWLVCRQVSVEDSSE